MSSHSPLLIGVAGGSGSGKTSVARAIHEQLSLDAVLLDMDAYYRDLAALPFDARTRVNFDHPDAFDMDLLVEQLGALRAGTAIEKPTYDYAAHTRAVGTVRIEPRDVILIEGILLFTDARLRQLLDIKVYVDVADDVRFIRRLRRDVEQRGRTLESVVEQYLGTVRPMHLDFVEPSKRYADVILPEGRENRVGVEMVLAHVLMGLAQRRGTLSLRPPGAPQ